MREEARGPLKVNTSNPRYFDDGSGRAVVLCGVSNGWELQDNAWDVPYTMDWGKFLDYLESYGLNRIRLWRVESTTLNGQTSCLTEPMPYKRTGPGQARDGLPKYDLNQFNPAYFERMLKRCTEAEERGIYVDVMLFERHSTFNKNDPFPWGAHPFNGCNNVNGVDAGGDPGGYGKGSQYFLLPSQGGKQEVFELQKSYLRKVLDTVGHLDNVLFEIANEAEPDADDWQKALIDFMHCEMAERGRSCPVGFTGPGKTLDGKLPDFQIQLESNADYVSPRNNTRYLKDPPANPGEKIILASSDHIAPFKVDNVWVWQSFTRGLQPQAIQHYGIYSSHEKPSEKDLERGRLVRVALGQCVAWAGKVDLVTMTPRQDLASSTYCLANPEKEYLVFLPCSGDVKVNLEALHGAAAVQWLDIGSGETVAAAPKKGGASRTFSSPFAGAAVLHLLHAD